jgi:hypothetical protein
MVSSLAIMQFQNQIQDLVPFLAYQVYCLKSASTGIGIPDLLIAQNSIQNTIPVYSIDKRATCKTMRSQTTKIVN